MSTAACHSTIPRRIAPHLVDFDRLIDVPLQKFFLADKIELEVLLNDARARRVGQRFEHARSSDR